MSIIDFKPQVKLSNHPYHEERVDLACAFRWAYRLGMYEAVANHFSVAVGNDEFLMNPNKRHFGLVKASEMLLLNMNNDKILQSKEPPDETAWFLHRALHRSCPHARAVLHVHSTYATVLASLQDSTMPPIDQNSAMFYGRVAIDTQYGGLALEEEGNRCAALLSDPKCKIMLMGNHGVLAIGDNIPEAFFQLYYFERAAKNLIKAYQTGKELRVLPHDIAQKTVDELDTYPDASGKFFAQLKEILDNDNDNFRE